MDTTVESNATPNQPKPPAALPAVEHESAVMAWFERNKKVVTYASVAVAVVAIGAWLFVETGRRKEIAGANALDQARGAYESGNLPAASTEFDRVSKNFAGTEAGYEAEIALNLVRLSSNQTQIAADELKKFADRNPPAFYASSAWALRGSALENLKKYDDAAQSYAKAGDLAVENYRKVDALLGAARSLKLAGKEPQALETLRGILAKFGKEVPGVAEAQVRLAEWTKGAM